MMQRRIGILGGTFDPVHCGHLRLAIALRDALAPGAIGGCVHLIPCRVPPHRKPPQASPEQRLAMLESAIAGCDGLQIDRRELHSAEISYSVHTLLSLRDAHPAAQLVLAVGEDAFAGFCRWYRWRTILKLAAIAVTRRPGSTPAAPPVQRLLQQRQVAMENLREPGQIAWLAVPPTRISSSEIRRRLAAGERPQALLPAAVARYIDRHHLYRLPETPGGG